MISSADIRRRFLRIGSRSVHYRRVGSGPPVVLVHGSPASSAILEAEMLALASEHTCFAFDTAGFGDSDGLADLSDGIGSLADALAANLVTMGFPPCPVFGTHTGAAIALELGRRHPRLVTGLVLDGVPMYTEQEQRDLFAGYFEPLEVDELGGHFARTWTRFRDLFMWFPWTTKTPATLNETDRPTAERLERWVTMFYRSARTYARPYKAAIAYGSQARAAIEALRVPAVFIANELDMLYPHLDRIPPLPAGQAIRRSTRSGHLAAIAGAVGGFAAARAAPADPPPGMPADGLGRQFLDFAHGQVLVRGRAASRPGAPTVLLLHDGPGSSRGFEPLCEALGDEVGIIAPDLPGCGESPGFVAAAPTLAQFAECVAAILDRLAVGPVRVLGRGFGASLGVELARLAPQRVTMLGLHGACLPQAALRGQMLARYAPRISIEPDGSHWYRTWLMLRDSLVYFPWYEGTRAALRRVPASFDAQRLHELTFEVLKQPGAWQQLIEAALRHDLAAALTEPALLRVPTIVFEDPLQPFSAFAPALRHVLPHARFEGAGARARMDVRIAELLGG